MPDNVTRGSLLSILGFGPILPLLNMRHRPECDATYPIKGIGPICRWPTIPEEKTCQ